MQGLLEAGEFLLHGSIGGGGLVQGLGLTHGFERSTQLG